MKSKGLLIFLSLHFLPVGSFYANIPSLDTRLLIKRPCPNFLKYTCSFKFLFESFKRLVNRLVFFNVNYYHSFTFIQKWTAKIMNLSKIKNNYRKIPPEAFYVF